MSSTLWSAGRYEAVAQQIAPIAEQVVATLDAKSGLAGSTVVDLACGTGSAAIAAARKGATVTALDITPELVALGEQKADAVGVSVDWRTGDASDTGLPAGSFDAAVSNMGIIFVEPGSQVAELARLLKSGGVLAFSSWVRDSVNPFFDPIVATLGAPPARGYSPDQWGDQAVAGQRLAADFDEVSFQLGKHPWRFESQAAALAFVTDESPMHVDIFSRLDADKSAALRTAFSDALETQTGADGSVAFDASYVVVTARRR
ncbi:SAM-dependent methyltransferase [Mycobacterium sp. MS1601]|uniref:class I SAM-dependent methyltransferase n=1 Tax=Mycobacterium sp. MS1601 TaxID=1936029 RepID=UPI0009798375|nr:class I SAM-dependent methyltransferase [Mycobacterium sp. MS1601]AQA01416.1 SAM-dependent methyltransferase [Mycobacterium sp. MS1601]